MPKRSSICLINAKFKKDKDIFIKKIAKLVKKRKNIGFAGYNSRKDLEKNLSWQIFDKNSPDKNFAFDKEKIKKITKETLRKCLREINEKLYIFIFPSYNKFTNQKMGGVGGNFSKYHVMLIFVNTSVKNWGNNLKETLCHEFAHVVSPHYNPWDNTIGERIIFEGIAENFQEDILKERKSMFSRILKENECKEIFEKISQKLNSKNSKEQDQLFYGSKEYKHWTGYALGYWLVKKYLKGTKKIDWKSVIKKNPNTILLEIKKKL